MIPYDHLRIYTFEWNGNKLRIREPIIADHVFIPVLESCEDNYLKVSFLIPKLTIEFNGSSYIKDSSFIATINRDTLRNLISLVLQFEMILKQIKPDLLYRNVWKMNNGSFSNFRDYESLPIDKYLLFLRIHNEEIAIINSRIER